ncbi:MAG: transcriptional regulator PpsR [Pseudomonadota bacterium]
MDAKTPPKGRGQETTAASAFADPALFLSDLTPRLATDIVIAAADLALIVEDGVVRDLAVSNPELERDGVGRDWQGRVWVDTVTEESRGKVLELLSPESSGPTWRQINHPSDTALDLPIRYAAVRLGDSDRIMAIGRDLREMSLLQQRLIEAHQTMERDYARLRETEARYRMLFDTVSEPVIIVNADSLSIEDANAAAEQALKAAAKDLHGNALTSLLQSRETRKIERLASDIVGSGYAAPLDVTLASGERVTVSATAVRQGADMLMVLRIVGAEPRRVGDTRREAMLAALERLPDGLVLVDRDLRIIACNPAFCTLANLAGDQEAAGATLKDFLGRSGTDLNVLISSLRKHEVVRNFATMMRDRFGREEQVEVSAVTAPYGDSDVYAFSVRSVARRLSESPRLSRQLPNSASQFTDLVGRVPLKDIVRDSTVLIEKLCIEAALEITDNNRASAAEMLGLSRQGLYSKIKRAGLED